MNINNTTILMGGQVNLSPMSSPIKGDINSLVAQTADIAAEEDMAMMAMRSNSHMIITSQTSRGPTLSREDGLYHAKAKMDLLLFGLTDKAKYALNEFDNLVRNVQEKIPSAQVKDWGFSLNEKDNIVIIGSNFTDVEKENILSVLEKSGIKDHLIGLRETLIAGMEHDRTTALYSKDIGKYDLTRDNFSEIINFKKFFSDAKNEVRQNIFAAVNAFEAQLKERAVIEYDKKSPPISIYI